MRIVISNPDSIGDLILRQPLYGALTAAGHELLLIVRPFVAPVAPMVAPGTQIVLLDADPYSPRFDVDSPEVQQAVDTAREFAPDVVCIAAYQRTQFDEYLVRRLPGARSVGFAGTFYRGLISSGLDLKSEVQFDESIAASADCQEVIKNERLCLALLGSRISLGRPRLEPTEAQVETAARKLAQFGLTPGTFQVACIGDNPYTAVRNWRHESWAELLSEMARRFGDRFVFIGTPDENETTEKIIGLMGDRASAGVNFCAPGDGLETLLGLTWLSNGYIGRDTGPMHLAAAMDKPVIAVFGGGTWPRFIPAAKSGVVSTVEVPCSGCDWTCHLSESYCVKRVPVSVMIEAIEELRRNSEGPLVVRALKPDELLRARLVREGAENAREERRRAAARENLYQVTKTPVASRLEMENEELLDLVRTMKQEIHVLADELIVLKPQSEEPAEGTPRGWPYTDPLNMKLPRTLMGGRPWPRISVITASFNQGRFIEETILSVLKQGYPNVEHIIIDGGSTDETAEILERYRNRLSYVVSEPDGGQSAAINKGMARATGDILTWLNSDDLLLPGALAGMAMAFATSGADMVAGICHVFSDAGGLLEQHLTSCADGPLPLDDLLDLEHCWNTGQFFYQPEVMFTREMWERAGGRVSEGLFYSMDYELWVRFAEAGARLHVIGRPIARYRRHENQKTYVEADFQAEMEKWRDSYRKKTGREGRSKPVPAEWRKRLRILLLNDNGYRYGAGIVQKRLAQAIGLAGQEVAAISLLDQQASSSQTPENINREVVKSIARYQPDLVITGNLHSAKADPWLLSAIGENFPVLSLVNDFWLLTGRCAYPSTCTKYLQGCDAGCPTPHEYPQLEPEKIAEAWNRKRQMLTRNPPFLLAYSRWAADFVRRTLPGLTWRMQRIRLSLPLDIFRPLDKKDCRRELGLPEDRFIVLATSEFAETRKGLDHLLAALRQLELPDLLLVSTSWSDPDPEKVGTIPFQRLGYMDDEQRLARVYAAADVLVGPSFEETFGQIFMEAAACGTPAIGYPLAAVPEAVIDGLTGRLAGGVGPEPLAAAIRELYDDVRLRRAMGSWGRLYAENEWSPFSAWRDLFLAFRKLGLLEKIHVPPKISFVATPRPIPDVSALPPPPQPGVMQLAKNAVHRVVAPKGSRVGEIAALTRESLILAKRVVTRLVV